MVARTAVQRAAMIIQKGQDVTVETDLKLSWKWWPGLLNRRCMARTI